MSGVDEVVAFVRRCVDEDERVAWEAIGSPAGNLHVHLGMSLWETRDIGGPAMPSVWERGKYVVARELSDEHAQHIARWDPARVLAEVEAKRQILRTHNRRHDCAWISGVEAACSTIVFMAQPYAGQDGWDPRWAL